MSNDDQQFCDTLIRVSFLALKAGSITPLFDATMHDWHQCMTNLHSQFTGYQAGPRGFLRPRFNLAREFAGACCGMNKMRTFRIDQLPEKYRARTEELREHCVTAWNQMLKTHLVEQIWAYENRGVPGVRAHFHSAQPSARNGVINVYTEALALDIMRNEMQEEEGFEGCACTPVIDDVVHEFRAAVRKILMALAAQWQPATLPLVIDLPRELTLIAGSIHYLRKFSISGLDTRDKRNACALIEQCGKIWEKMLEFHIFGLCSEFFLIC